MHGACRRTSVPDICSLPSCLKTGQSLANRTLPRRTCCEPTAAIMPSSPSSGRGLVHLTWPHSPASQPAPSPGITFSFRPPSSTLVGYGNTAEPIPCNGNDGGLVRGAPRATFGVQRVFYCEGFRFPGRECTILRLPPGPFTRCVRSRAGRVRSSAVVCDLVRYSCREQILLILRYNLLTPGILRIDRSCANQKQEHPHTIRLLPPQRTSQST